MAANSSQQVCDSHTVLAFPEEGNIVSMDDSIPLKGQLSLVDQVNSQTYFMKMVENGSEKDVDIEKGELNSSGMNEETVGNLKIDEKQMKSLQNQISFEMGRKYMHLLMNHSLILPKFSTRVEKVVEVPRMRKFKRSASFNSRKVVFLFSLLSSLGTIILIYLTLKVKQISDDSFHSI